MSILRKLWWGQYSLQKAFWGFYVLGFFVCWLVVGLVYAPFFILRLRTIGFILSFIIFISYQTVAAVGVWRSANTYPFRGFAGFWAIAAKAVVCLVVGRFLWALANGGALALMARMTRGIDVGISG
jgi:hypothetical protein